MKTYTSTELVEVLRLHRLWREGDTNGKRADLGGADLRGAYLGGADLGGADLGGADLRGAYLRGADLRDAYLRGADLRGAYLRGAYLGGAKGLPIPFASKEESTATLDRIREIVLAEPERLTMDKWHGSEWKASKVPEKPGQCGTTHCLAGWAQALSTDVAVRKLDPQFAGMLLIPTATHMFFSSNDAALRFLRDREYAKAVKP